MIDRNSLRGEVGLQIVDGEGIFGGAGADAGDLDTVGEGLRRSRREPRAASGISFSR